LIVDLEASESVDQRVHGGRIIYYRSPQATTAGSPLLAPTVYSDPNRTWEGIHDQ